MKQALTTPAILLLAAHACPAQWEPQTSGTTSRLRGLAVVNQQVVWASGTDGMVLRTADGGKTWTRRPVPHASGLDFRDIQAVGADTACLLSIGPGEKSRVYKTADGGTTWALCYLNRDPKVFLDAIAFWDEDHGLALGDPIDGRFVVLRTEDGGTNWERVPPEGMPPALPGEGAFAASGTCLVVSGDRHAWFGSGGAKVSRVFRSEDGGKAWRAHKTPVRAGTPSSGIFSLAFRDPQHGVAVGGDYKNPGEAAAVAAVTGDGGRSWAPAKGPQPGGYRSDVAFVPGVESPTLVAAGPTGTDLSADGGESWRRLGAVGFDAVGFAASRIGWAVGEEGRIARFSGTVTRRP
jgi:photosystem II stability/assembly factor-like uncharacterized protein